MNTFTVMVTETTATNNDDLHHIQCCVPNTALCGADLTNSTHAERPLPGEERCEVCYEWEESEFPCSIGCDA